MSRSGFQACTLRSVLRPPDPTSSPGRRILEDGQKERVPGLFGFRRRDEQPFFPLFFLRIHAGGRVGARKARGGFVSDERGGLAMPEGRRRLVGRGTTVEGRAWAVAGAFRRSPGPGGAARPMWRGDGEGARRPSRSVRASKLDVRGLTEGGRRDPWGFRKPGRMP